MVKKQCAVFNIQTEVGYANKKLGHSFDAYLILLTEQKVRVPAIIVEKFLPIVSSNIHGPQATFSILFLLAILT